ncbi:MAG: SCO family protein [Betaproteobacteria bacterium]|nr:SCO family protein [Betaproteobacteria bacterium]
MSSLAVLAPLAALTAALNVSLGRLRAGAGRRSHRRFGLLAASAFLVVALRYAFGLAWSDALPLLAAMLLGRVAGSRWPEAAEPSPLRWRTAAYATLIAGLFLFLGEPAHAQVGNEWNRIDANEPAPAFTLIDQNGKRVSLKDFRGKALLVSFIYTECKDICPVLPQIVGRADQWLTAEEKTRTRFVGISLDPNRDNPAKLRAFMKQHNLSPERWTLLTGSLKEATQAANGYGIVAKPDINGDIVHNAVYILIDPQGNLRTEFHGLFSPSEEIAKVLREIGKPQKPAKTKG